MLRNCLLITPCQYVRLNFISYILACLTETARIKHKTVYPAHSQVCMHRLLTTSTPFPMCMAISLALHVCILYVPIVCSRSAQYNTWTNGACWHLKSIAFKFLQREKRLFKQNFQCFGVNIVSVLVYILTVLFQGQEVSS